MSDDKFGDADHIDEFRRRVDSGYSTKIGAQRAILNALDHRDAEIVSLTNMIDIYKAEIADLEECELTQDAEIAKLRECAERMAEALNESKRTHTTCEDCWYSCPRSGECCDDRQSGCNCGADSDNARIDAALAPYRASFPKPEAKP